jgi:hypothetical protein
MDRIQRRSTISPYQSENILNERRYSLGPAAFNILGGAISHSIEQDWS